MDAANQFGIFLKPLKRFRVVFEVDPVHARTLSEARPYKIIHQSRSTLRISNPNANLGDLGSELEQGDFHLVRVYKKTDLTRPKVRAIFIWTRKNPALLLPINPTLRAASILFKNLCLRTTYRLEVFTDADPSSCGFYCRDT